MQLAAHHDSRRSEGHFLRFLCNQAYKRVSVFCSSFLANNENRTQGVGCHAIVHCMQRGDSDHKGNGVRLEK